MDGIGKENIHKADTPPHAPALGDTYDDTGLLNSLA